MGLTAADGFVDESGMKRWLRRAGDGARQQTDAREKPFARFNTQTYKTRLSLSRMNLPHLPALRRGKPYESLDSVEVLNHRTGEPMARVSQVNAGIVRKDLARIGEARAALKKFTVAELIDISAKAGEHFLN